MKYKHFHQEMSSWIRAIVKWEAEGARVEVPCSVAWRSDIPHFPEVDDQNAQHGTCPVNKEATREEGMLSASRNCVNNPVKWGRALSHW